MSTFFNFRSIMSRKNLKHMVIFWIRKKIYDHRIFYGLRIFCDIPTTLPKNHGHRPKFVFFLPLMKRVNNGPNFIPGPPPMVNTKFRQHLVNICWLKKISSKLANFILNIPWSSIFWSETHKVTSHIFFGTKRCLRSHENFEHYICTTTLLWLIRNLSVIWIRKDVRP